MTDDGATRGLLFTDLESSTEHLNELGSKYGAVLGRHHEIIRSAVAAEGGVEVGSEGDSIASVFPTVDAALRAAIAAQRSLNEAPWPDKPWRVRMAVHVGLVEATAAGAVGRSLHEAARIRNVGHGGQVLVSDAASQLLAERAIATFRDLGLHSVRDFDRPVRLHQLVADGLATEFPALRTSNPSRIPRTATSFIGRDKEVDRVLDVLDRSQLVTIVGAGGSGKTRLAFEAGLQFAAPEVATVLLANLRSAEQVPAAFASAVGARTANDVVASVGHRDLLLIVDNCEHVPTAVAALVAEILAQCPNVRLLCTSRQPLEITGEAVYAVPALALGDAVELFVERAPVEIRTAQRELVQSICSQLDGQPLAIELAAARLRSLTLEDVSERLRDQLGLLTSGSAAVPRQQTLRATLDWSYALLSADEQTLLRYLGVFAGGFSLRGVESFMQHARLSIDVLATLDALVLRSLVEFSPDARRYRMLEPVRQYAVDRLEVADEWTDAVAAHIAWVCQLAGEGSRRLFVDQALWTAILDAEAGNIGAALGAALERDEIVAASRIVSLLAWYWFTSQRADAFVWAPQLIARLDEMDAPSRGRALVAAGIIFCDVANDPRPLEWLEEAERYFREIQHERALGSALFWRGRATAGWRQFDVAKRCFDEGVEVHERLGDKFGELWCRVWQSLLARALGEGTEAAERSLRETVAKAEGAGVLHVVAAAKGELGMFAAARGDTASAINDFEESLRMYRDIGDRWQIAIALHRLAVGCGVAEPTRAAQLTIEAIEMAATVHADVNLARMLLTAAGLLLRADRESEAARLVAAARDTQKSGVLDAEAVTLMNLDVLNQLPNEPAFSAVAKAGRAMRLEDAAALAVEYLRQAFGLVSLDPSGS